MYLQTPELQPADGDGGDYGTTGAYEDTTSDTTEFETGSDTLSYGDLAGSTTTDGDEIVVEDTDLTSESSPAGGAGFTDAVARVTGTDSDTVQNQIEEHGQDAVGEVVEDMINSDIHEDDLEETVNEAADESSNQEDPTDVGLVESAVATLTTPLGMLAVAAAGVIILTELGVL